MRTGTPKARNAAAPSRGFVSTRPSETWEEGLICGNGTIGANALSRPLDEIIIFSHERIYLPGNGPETPFDMAAELPGIRKLIERLQFQEAHRKGVELSGRDQFRYPDSFVPAFNLHIDTSATGEIRDYWRSVDFSTGVATVHWADDRGPFERRLFVSRADGAGVLQIVGPGRGLLNCGLRLAACEPASVLHEKAKEKSSEVFKSHIDGVRTTADTDHLTYSCRFTKAYAGSIQSLNGVAHVVAPGAGIASEGDRLIITDAERVLVLIGIAPVCEPDVASVEELKDMLEALASENICPGEPRSRRERATCSPVAPQLRPTNPLRLSVLGAPEKTEQRSEAGLPPDYAALLERHVSLHGELFGRVHLDIGGGADDQRTSEELLASSTDEELSCTLVEKVFDAGRYNIISSTGETPPNLQGLWAGSHISPWSGGYTQNGNLPSAIACLLRGNTPELMRGYTGYIESLESDMKLNARNIFGARGYVLPNHTSSHASSLLPFCFGGSTWTGGAAWAAHFFYDTYLYTGDKEFLVEHALPFMEQVALFFEDFLYEGSDGKYLFNPSVSPENNPANSHKGVQPAMNATMEVAAVRELLQNLVSASRRLGVNASRIPVWESMLAKMPGYILNNDGMVKEWLHPDIEDNIDHRHSSQLYPLFDGLPEEIERDPQLMEGFRRIVAHKLGTYYRESKFMAFGIVQLALAATSLGESELAYRCLAMLVTSYWGNNLASMHNPHECFNMDISGGLPAVVIKMLLDSRPGAVRLLPALPKQWPTGTLEGALCRGRIKVVRLSWRPRQIEVTMLSGAAQSITLVASHPIAAIAIVAGNAEVTAGTHANVRQLALPENEKVNVKIELAGVLKSYE